MKQLLFSLTLITVFILGVTSCTDSKEKEAPLNRYDISEAVNPTDTLMCLKSDMKPLSGVVYCEFGDVGTYKDGKLEGVHREWYEDGKLKSEHNYKDEKREGVSKDWYENGQLKWETNYKNDEYHGASKGWYENGQFMYDYYFKKGKINGVAKFWYEGGQLKWERNFKNDKLIDCKGDCDNLL
tara:strand:- start:1182 stop:1730 length:549 start_codon:yes stop_codon:yes gene_type:complete